MKNYKFILIMLMADFLCKTAFGQMLQLRKTVFQVATEDIMANENYLFKESKNDTLVYRTIGNYQKPTRIFKFVKDSCVSYTALFHRVSNFAIYQEEMPDKRSYREVSLFTPEQSKAPELLLKQNGTPHDSLARENNIQLTGNNTTAATVAYTAEERTIRTNLNISTPQPAPGSKTQIDKNSKEKYIRADFMETEKFEEKKK